LAETKKDREILSKWGNALRQTFRTIATAAEVSEVDAKLLMNPAIPSVNPGYITRHKLLENHLRSQQQAISSAVFTALGASITQDCAAALARAGAPPPGRNHLRWETVRSTLGCWNDGMDHPKMPRVSENAASILVSRSNPSWASLS